jgi:hypothetical protein
MGGGGGGAAFAMTCLLFIFIFGGCYCKYCKNGLFWLWDKWTPKDCWRKTQEKCCVSIHNYNGSRVIYSKTNTSPSPAISTKSLPELGSTVTEQPKRMTNDKIGLEESEPIAIRTRTEKMFR